MPFIIDAHLDLSMNALEWNRDLRQPLKEINRREIGMTDKPDRGNATISFEELRKGNVGLVVATQIGRYVGPDNPLPVGIPRNKLGRRPKANSLGIRRWKRRVRWP